jgi:hypothetical protein
MAKANVTMTIPGIDPLAATRWIREAVRVVADQMKQEIQSTISTPGPTPHYKSMRGADARANKKFGKPTGGGVPSARGEPPHMRTGDLRSSVEVKARMGGNRGFGVDAYVIRPYGRYLEEGTGKMAARPYLQPVMVGQLDRWNRLFQHALAQVIEKRIGRKG